MSLPGYGFSEAAREQVINSKLRSAAFNISEAMINISVAQAYVFDDEVRAELDVWLSVLDDLFENLEYTVDGDDDE